MADLPAELRMQVREEARLPAFHALQDPGRNQWAAVKALHDMSVVSQEWRADFFADAPMQRVYQRRRALVKQAHRLVIPDVALACFAVDPRSAPLLTLMSERRLGALLQRVASANVTRHSGHRFGDPYGGLPTWDEDFRLGARGPEFRTTRAFCASIGALSANQQRTVLAWVERQPDAERLGLLASNFGRLTQPHRETVMQLVDQLTFGLGKAGVVSRLGSQTMHMFESEIESLVDMTTGMSRDKDMTEAATALAGMGAGWASFSVDQKDKLLGMLGELEQRVRDAREQGDGRLQSYEAWLAKAVCGLAAAMPHMQEDERTQVFEAAGAIETERFKSAALGGFGRVWGHLSTDPDECVRRQDRLISALATLSTDQSGYMVVAVRGLLPGLGEMKDHHRRALVTHASSLPARELALSLKELGPHFKYLSDGEQRAALAAVAQMSPDHARLAILGGRDDLDKGLIGGLIHIDADLRSPVLDRMMRESGVTNSWRVACGFARIESSLSDNQQRFLRDTRSAMTPVEQARLLSRMVF